MIIRDRRQQNESRLVLEEADNVIRQLEQVRVAEAMLFVSDMAWL